MSTEIIASISTVTYSFVATHIIVMDHVDCQLLQLLFKVLSVSVNSLSYQLILLPHITKLFQLGINHSNYQVRQICKKSLIACESVLHPHTTPILLRHDIPLFDNRSSSDSSNNLPIMMDMDKPTKNILSIQDDSNYSLQKETKISFTESPPIQVLRELPSVNVPMKNEPPSKKRLTNDRNVATVQQDDGDDEYPEIVEESSDDD